MKFVIFFLLFSTLFLQSCSKTIMFGTTLLISKSIFDTRSINTQINDSKIEKEINREINRKIKDEIRIISIVYRNKLLLIGQVPTNNLNYCIQDFASKIHNGCIYNFIKNEKPISYIKIFQDYIITLKIYLNILINEKMEILNTKIVTENKEVFLFTECNKENKKNILKIINLIKNMQEIRKYFCI